MNFHKIFVTFKFHFSQIVQFNFRNVNNIFFFFFKQTADYWAVSKAYAEWADSFYLVLIQITEYLGLAQLSSGKSVAWLRPRHDGM